MQLSIAPSFVLVGAVAALGACGRSARSADDQAALSTQSQSGCVGRATLTVRNHSGASIEIVEVERARSTVIAEVAPGTETVTINPRPGVRYIARRIRDRQWVADEGRPARLDRGVQLERSCRQA